MSEQAHQVRYRAGVPVFAYRTTPEVPPVSVSRFRTGHLPANGQRHIHDFPVLAYFEQAGDGSVQLLAPGTVVDPAVIDRMTSGCCVFFDPTALSGDGWSSWRAHPLLLPFLHGTPSGVLRLVLPEERRPVWSSTIAALEAELDARAEGFRQAALAYLTLLLVDVARLATDVVGDLRRSNETLLAEVFDVIEQEFAGPLSLRDVAEKVGVTPGHLTTLVRRRTGRTVLDWITERRMTQARTLLTSTDLPVNEVGRRTGLPDPGYFARVFRQVNGVSPREWRRADVGRRG